MIEEESNNASIAEFKHWWATCKIENIDWTYYKVAKIAYLDSKLSSQVIIDMLCWRLDIASSCIHDSETCKKDQEIIKQYESAEHRKARGK